MNFTSAIISILVNLYSVDKAALMRLKKILFLYLLKFRLRKLDWQTTKNLPFKTLRMNVRMIPLDGKPDVNNLWSPMEALIAFFISTE